MITMLGTPRKCCDGLTRRETLQAGAATMLGGMLGLPQLANASLGDASKWPSKAKSVVVLYLLGGAPTQDMFDLKPQAPSGIRGEFRPIASNVPGIDVSNQLPKHAPWMDKSAIVRTVSHKGGCHNPMPSLTGYPELLPSIGVVQDNLPPSIGSVCEYLREDRNEMPNYVHMPCMLGWGQHIRRAGPYGGFLGRQYDPLFTECMPTAKKPAAGDYYPETVYGVPRLPVAKLPPGVTIDRLNKRRQLATQIEDSLRKADGSDAFSRAQQGALNLLTSKRVRDAFRVDTVPRADRELYGDTLFGNSALIARKLVEQGVQFINVTWDMFSTRPGKLDPVGWDTHQRNFPILKDVLLPNYDHTFNGLMTDLNRRGLLDDTLVVVMSDMGRTPKVNKNGGRDHWTYCYSVLFAGAGVKGGTLYGTSDDRAAYVKDKPVSPADVCATIYACLGIDPDTQIPDLSGQPVRVAGNGRVIRDILA